ncbi:ribonuclease E/G [Jannaschia sp. LMIT008]|uniref:ribonuclease E/G n=1 Tax=Jannaschia maritima TaxID=3032585 RepID=UPI0028119E83|nr:ribonuclease E/G [Jannaschia sp. LMIT008]
MKGTLIVLGRVADRPAAALIREGVLDDLLIDGPDAEIGPGAVFRGICDRPAKGQGGVFLRLGGGRTGYLRGVKGIAPGDALLVQATGFAEDGKAVPLSARPLFKSRFCIVTPGAPGLNVARSIRDDELRDVLLEAAHDALPAERGQAGLILRSACAAADHEAVSDDVAATWDLAMRVTGDAGGEPELLLAAPDAHELAWRDWPVAADVSHDWAVAVDLIPDVFAARQSVGGATLFVEPTRALVAVDVNTADLGAAGGLKANIAAVRGLPRLLRVRGLGGQIVIDPAPMPKKDRRTLESALKAAFRTDPVDTTFVGWTPLGHVELTRKRERRPLEEPT